MVYSVPLSIHNNEKDLQGAGHNISAATIIQLRVSIWWNQNVHACNIARETAINKNKDKNQPDCDLIALFNFVRYANHSICSGGSLLQSLSLSFSLCPPLYLFAYSSEDLLQ